MKFETTVNIQFDNQEQLKQALDSLSRSLSDGDWKEVSYNKVDEALITVRTKTNKPQRGKILKSKL